MLTLFEIGMAVSIPLSVGVCPVCGMELVADIDEWEYDDDGCMMVGEQGLNLSCVSEPEIGTNEWQEWFDGHHSMPYETWHPLIPRVLKWINLNYRFANAPQPQSTEELRHWFVASGQTESAQVRP